MRTRFRNGSLRARASVSTAALSLCRRQVELVGAQMVVSGQQCQGACPVHWATEEPGVALRGERRRARAAAVVTTCSGGGVECVTATPIF